MAKSEEQAKTQASKRQKTTIAKKEENGDTPRRSSNVALILLVGALIGLGGLLVGGAVGYALGFLRAGANVPPTERAFLGVGVLYIEEGALIHELYPDGPAEEAGLLVGDIILRLDGQLVDLESPLEPILEEHQPGDEVRVVVIRGGERETFDVELGATPADFEPAPFPLPSRRTDIEPGQPDFNFPVEPAPFLGVEGGREQGRGVIVERVLPGSPAEEAGLRDGDVILSVNGERVDTFQELRDWVYEVGVGGELVLEYRRDDETEEIRVEVGEQFPTMPPDFEAKVAYLGVTVGTFTRELSDELDLPFERGVLIQAVDPDSPAARVQLRERDIILQADDERVRDADAFIEIVRAHEPGDVLRLVVLRDGDERDFEVALGSRAEFSFADPELFASELLEEDSPGGIDIQMFPPGCLPGETDGPCL